MGRIWHWTEAASDYADWRSSMPGAQRLSDRVLACDHARGVTLIELLVVVAVIAILVAVAYGSYSNHIVRTHRVAAQNAMLEIANRQQQYFLANRAYAEELADLGYSLPPEVASRYGLTLAVNNSATPPTFRITLTPIPGSSQAADGTLTLDQAGVKTPADKWK